ncbi:uncharacterized protein LOC122503923 [Leptopilina heterotoma]|uniref:uncharacterized protein LOC122503923 n=1 Tax=Leptopilina heterotoma TaxID=63436 RepID=UPI001CA9F8B8|nr:uncharacterized protein LOC122503923 [Leptopilina heterotoma]
MIEHKSKNSNLTLTSLKRGRNNISQNQIINNKANIRYNNRIKFANYLKKTIQLFTIIINQTVNITKQLNPIVHSRYYYICKLDLKVFENVIIKKFQKKISLESLNSRAAVNNMVIIYSKTKDFYLHGQRIKIWNILHTSFNIIFTNYETIIKCSVEQFASYYKEIMKIAEIINGNIFKNKISIDNHNSEAVSYCKKAENVLDNLTFLIIKDINSNNEKTKLTENESKEEDNEDNEDNNIM